MDEAEVGNSLKYPCSSLQESADLQTSAFTLEVSKCYRRKALIWRVLSQLIRTLARFGHGRQMRHEYPNIMS
jgi:hypothetical protein